MIAINYRDPRPIYEQIQAELRRLMLTAGPKIALEKMTGSQISG